MQTNLRSLFGGCLEGVTLPPKRPVGRPPKKKGGEEGEAVPSELVGLVMVETCKNAK